MRSLDGGIHAKEEANAHRNYHSHNYSPERNRGWKSGQKQVDEQTDADAQYHAYDAARAREDDGLGQELPDDVAAARSNRFSHAYFAGALRDRHQHDIHDSDSAHQQSNRADHGGQQGD